MPKYSIAILLFAAAMSGLVYMESSTRAESPQQVQESLAIEAVLKSVPEDRLTKPLPQNLVKFKTAADTFSCTPGLCRTIEEPAPIMGEGPEVSKHAVRLSAASKPRELTCREGASSDLFCAIGGLTIDGEQFYAFGDGCLYVRQRLNAYFPLTKKFCEQPGGRFERSRQNLYAIGLDETAERDISALSVSDAGSLKFKLRAGTRYRVVAAELDETEDSVMPRRYLVQNTAGLLGWAAPEAVATQQCPMDTSRICFYGD